MFPLRVFKPDYIVCYHNRTVGIEKCSKGYFHPVTRLCTEIVDPGNCYFRIYKYVVFFCSPKLKAQFRFSHRLSSVICLSVNFSYLHLLQPFPMGRYLGNSKDYYTTFNKLLLQNQMANFSKRNPTKHPQGREIIL